MQRIPLTPHKTMEFPSSLLRPPSSVPPSHLLPLSHQNKSNACPRNPDATPLNTLRSFPYRLLTDKHRRLGSKLAFACLETQRPKQRCKPTAITKQQTLTYGLSRSPTLAHFQNMPKTLKKRHPLSAWTFSQSSASFFIRSW